ncbi:MAG: DMT family transporter [Chitinophagaceae bacterium]|nr:DMT family transporter [Chitinophagaceae bacterium]
MKKAFLQLHAAIFLAGFTGILGRLIELNEVLLVWYRMMFAAFALLLITIITKKIIKLHFSEMLRLIGIGGIVALHWVFFYGSIKYSNVSVSLVCFSAIGFFSALLDPLLSKRKFEWIELLLGLMVIIGIYLMFHFDPHFRTGILFGMISSLLAAIFPILNKKMMDKHQPEIITFYEMSGGFFLLTLLLPFYLAFFPTEYLYPSTSDLIWLLVLSLFCTVLAFNLSIRSLTKISPFTVNLSFNLEPVYGIALAFIYFKEYEEVGIPFYIGIAIIFLTVVLQTLRVYKQASTK